VSLRIATLGTSITWGQGLNRDETFASLLRAHLEDVTGQAVTLESYAHSGAKLWRGDLSRGALALAAPKDAGDCLTKARAMQPAPQWPGSEAWREWLGECPDEEPYLWLQLMEAAHDFADPGDAVDLVVVDVGVNDVDIITSLEPGSDYRRRIQNLRGAIAPFLSAIHASPPFAKAHVLVPGYYPVFSSDSSAANVPPGGTLAWLLDGVDVKLTDAALADLAKQGADWVATMHACLQEEIGAANVGSREGTFAYFVDPLIPATGALFASKQLLWGPDGNGNAVDHARERRAGAHGCCEQRATGTIDKLLCERASFGHPGPDAAVLYAEALFVHCQALALV
jgi:hypothetical protein